MYLGNASFQRHLCVFSLFLLLMSIPALAQDHTVGLMQYNKELADNGYTLYMPMRGTDVHLIDMYGRVINTWPSTYQPGNMVVMKENGNIVRSCKLVSGAGGGKFQEIDWDNNILWDWDFYTDDYLPHHDMKIMPNGNLIFIAWDRYTMEEAIQAGRDTVNITEDGLSPEMIVEVRPIYPDSAEIVWQWRLFDHLIQDFDSTKDNYGVVEEHYELMDINYPIGSNINDWVHCNGLDYNPDLDQVVISSRSVSEIWVIDHSTSTAEAAGHGGGASGNGGDFLYRFGNPQVYRAGTEEDRTLFGQHDPRWIPPGAVDADKMMVFNNGFQRPEGGYSTIDVLMPPVDESGRYPTLFPGVPFGPTSYDWTYIADPPEDFNSPFISGAQRLMNDNTVICEGRSGRLFEVTYAGEIVWSYINPEGMNGVVPQGGTPSANAVFKIERHGPDHPGLTGKDLIPGPPLELYPITIAQTAHTPTAPSHYDSVFVSSLVYSEHALTMVALYVDTGDGFQQVTMFDDGDHHDGTAGDSVFGAVFAPMAPETQVEYYIFTQEENDSTVVDPTIAPATNYGFVVELGPYLCGDVDGSEVVNVSDAVALVAYIFGGGAPPDPLAAGDVDCNGVVNISDVVYLINFIFGGGPAPCANC